MRLDLVRLLRNLRRSPASAVAAVLTLSLTLGAGASIFAILDAVVLTPPPFTNPDALVIVGETPIDEPGAAPRAVASRRTELALRIALGADSRRILNATLGRSASMVGVGQVVGSLLSVWAARALSSVLFATDRFDVLSVGIAAAVLVISGVGAVLPAALRAANTDPLIALRAE